MSGLQPGAPRACVRVTYTVTYYSDLDQWVADVWTSATTAEGATVPGGSTRREFGPFDDRVTVAQWMCQQVHSYTKSQRGEVISPPPDPPQGRTLPES